MKKNDLATGSNGAAWVVHCTSGTYLLAMVGAGLPLFHSSRDQPLQKFPPIPLPLPISFFLVKGGRPYLYSWFRRRNSPGVKTASVRGPGACRVNKDPSRRGKLASPPLLKGTLQRRKEMHQIAPWRKEGTVFHSNSVECPTMKQYIHIDCSKK